MSQSQVASYRGNCQRTGEYLDFGVPDLHSIAWQFQTQGPIENTPVVANGLVLFGSSDGFFYAVDRQTGELLWHRKMRGKLTSPADVANGVVYFGGNGGTLYAVDLQTGQDRWIWDETCLPSEEELFTIGLLSQGFSPEEIEEAFEAGIFLPEWSFDTFAYPTIRQRQLYVLARDTLLAFDPNTAKLLWWQFLDADVSCPTVGDGLVYTTSFLSPRRKGFLYTLDAKTGVPNWPFSPQSDPPYWVSYAEQLAVRENLLYIGTYSGIYMIDMKQQKEVGYIPFQPFVESVDGIAIGQDIIYATVTGLMGKNRSIVAYRRQDGKLLWRYDPEQERALRKGYPGREMAPTLASGILYLARWDGICMALNATTGQECWQIQVSEGIEAPPCIAQETVFVAAGNSVYALH